MSVASERNYKPSCLTLIPDLELPQVREDMPQLIETANSIHQTSQVSQITTSSFNGGSSGDWLDREKLKSHVLKQNRYIEKNKFDPFGYFGAIDVPVLEECPLSPPHPKIEKLLSSNPLKQRMAAEQKKLRGNN